MIETVTSDYTALVNTAIALGFVAGVGIGATMTILLQWALKKDLERGEERKKDALELAFLKGKNEKKVPK